MSAATRTRRNQLVLIALVQVLAMALWFSASAVMPALRQEWSLGSGQATLLATSLQLGFVCGAVCSAVLNLADRIPPHLLMGVCALIGAGLTASVAAGAGGFEHALVARFGTGMALAGVYPIGMKLMTTWFLAGRGFAMGVLIAALTLGSSLPQFLVSVSEQRWPLVVWWAATLAAIGGLVALLLVRPGPHRAPSPPFAPRYAARMFRNREQAGINFGYLGHMWELYAFWTWLPVFVAATGAMGPGLTSQSPRVAITAFVTIGIAGTVGCVFAGSLSGRYGPVRVARWALTTSGCCAATSYLVSFAPAIVLLPVLAVWGASVIADSGQFSAALSSATEPEYVGTALTIQTALGFLLTTVTIQGLPLLAEITGWRLAFTVLCLGPALGVLALRRVPVHVHSG